MEEIQQLKRNWDGIRYKEQLEACRSFNQRLLHDRRVRQPYLDSHSGIQQIESRQYLETHRRISAKPDQVYLYTSRKWSCKSRPSMEQLCPNDPPDRPPTPETALDELLARHLANNDSADSEEDTDPAYNGAKRKRKTPGRRRGRKAAQF